MTDQTRNTDLTSIERATAYIIQRTARLLRFNLSKFLAEYQISPEQWYILFKLYENPGRSQNQLADPNLNDHPNITRMVDGLQGRDLLKRTQDPNDRRRYLLYLTESGEGLMEDLFPRVIELRASIFANISDAEIEMLVSIMHRIDDNLINGQLATDSGQ
ncbi:MAG: MarR family transcriptional regulator [Chloroflexota bacterium]